MLATPVGTICHDAIDSRRRRGRGTTKRLTSRPRDCRWKIMVSVRRTMFIRSQILKLPALTIQPIELKELIIARTDRYTKKLLATTSCRQNVWFETKRCDINDSPIVSALLSKRGRNSSSGNFKDPVPSEMRSQEGDCFLQTFTWCRLFPFLSFSPRSRFPKVLKNSLLFLF